MFDDVMVNAWIGGTMVAVVAGAVGFFVVLRGASFAAHALPLSAFPGAAASNLLGLDPTVGLIAFSILGVLGIAGLSRRHHGDLATALTLVMLLGLGALFLSRTTEYHQAVFALLFGELLGISDRDLLLIAALGAACVAALAAAFRPLLLCSASPDLGAARGVSAARVDLLFLLVVALATAVSLPVVGALLVFSLMVGPASAARAFADRPGPALLLSAALAVLTVWAAIALSYASDLPVGFFVGALGAASYGAGRLRLRAPAARRGRGRDPAGAETPGTRSRRTV